MVNLLKSFTDDPRIKQLGPGLITGAADDDPSGIATYSQAGAQFGYNMLWTVLFTYPLMVGIQMVSARLGFITGKGLAANVKADFPRPVLYGSGYEAFLPRAVEAERPMPIRLVGKHCETGDMIVSEGFVPADLKVGDIMATPVTGAYGYSMASNYNKVPRPEVVFVSGGVARTVVRRESLDDLIRLDL